MFGRPIAVNLIDARLGEVVALLDGLARGEGTSDEAKQTRASWRDNVLSAYGGRGLRGVPPAPSAEPEARG